VAFQRTLVGGIDRRTTHPAARLIARGQFARSGAGQEIPVPPMPQ